MIYCFTNSALFRACILALAAVQALSQGADLYGVRFGYDVDLHQADFAKMTDLGYCCPTNFGSASGSTLYGGIGYNASMSDEFPSPLRIDFAVGLQRRTLNLSFMAPTYINDPETNQGFDATINYAMDVSRMDVTLDIMPQISLSRTSRISIGGRLGYALASELSQREILPQELVDKGFYFIDAATNGRSPSRNIFVGPVPGLNALAASAVASISSDFRLDQLGKLLLTPSIWYRYHFNGFTDAVTSRVVDGATGTAIQSPGRWSTQSVGVSLAISMATNPTRELAPCEELMNGSIVQKTCLPGQILRIDPRSGVCRCEDTLYGEPTIVKIVDTTFVNVVDTSLVTIDAVYAVRDGKREVKPLDAVTISRFKRINYLPLYHSVHFNEGSSNIDFVQRYLDVSPERKKTFASETMFIRNYQKHVLNVIGTRFANGEVSQITLIGFGDDAEKRDSLLSLERAMKVREYLYRRWAIPMTSIAVRAADDDDRKRYRTAMESMGGLQSVLILLDKETTVLEYITIVDKKITIDPESLYVGPTISLSSSRKPSSLDYQLRLGGNTGGKMAQPIRTVANSDEKVFETLIQGWTVPLSGPNGTMVENAQALPVGSGSKLIPSLRVTTTNGQVFEAQRNNQSSVVPVVVRESMSDGLDANDSLFASFTIVDYGNNSPLTEQQASLVRNVLDSLGVRTQTVNVEYRELGARQTTATSYTDTRRVSELLNLIGVRQDQVSGMRVVETSADGQLPSSGNAVLKITIGMRK